MSVDRRLLDFADKYFNRRDYDVKNGYIVARCPGHSERDRSIRIKLSDKQDKITFTCFSEDEDQVMRTLGIDYSELYFQEPKTNGKSSNVKQEYALNDPSKKNDIQIRFIGGNGKRYFKDDNKEVKSQFSNLDKVDLREPTQKDCQIISESLGKHYSLETLHKAGVKISSTKNKDEGYWFGLAFQIEYNPNGRMKNAGQFEYNPNNITDRILFVEGRTDYLTAIEKGLYEHFSIISRFNTTAYVKIPDYYNYSPYYDDLNSDKGLYFIFDKWQPPSHVNFENFKNEYAYFRWIYPGVADDLSDYFFDSRFKSSKEDLLDKLKYSNKYWHLYKIPNKCKFWSSNITKNNNVNIKIHQNKLLYFLEYKGFFKWWVNKNRSIFLYEINNKLDTTTLERMSDLIINYIENLPEIIDYNCKDSKHLIPVYRDILDNKFKNNINNIMIKQKIKVLNQKEPEFIRDDEFRCYLPFYNGVVEIKKDSIKLLNYKKIKKQLWKNDINDHYIDLNDLPEGIEEADIDFFDNLEYYCEFQDFILSICSDRSRDNLPVNTSYDKHRSFISTIGYLIHTYKDPILKKAIILLDSNINCEHEPEGQTGKGLFIKGISKARELVIEDGRNFDFNNPNAWQRVNLDTRIVAFEDTHKKFPFDRMFSILTEGIKLKKLYEPEIYIPYEYSPKFIFSSNFNLSGVSASHRNRRHELELSNFFSVDYSPFNHYNSKFFDNNYWNEKEWNKFYCFIISCLLYYLKFGLIDYEKSNLIIKKLIDETNYDFAKFVSHIDKNVWHSARVLKKYFLHLNPEYAETKTREPSTKKFMQWIRKYCRIYGLDISDNKTLKIDKNDEKCFLIKSNDLNKKASNIKERRSFDDYINKNS